MGNARYSGKPHTDIRVPHGAYTKLDVTVPGPRESGHEERLLYVNVKVTWKITDKKHPDYYRQVANLRLYWARATRPVDETSYHDYTITPIKPSFLITLVHFEEGEKGIGGAWYAEIDGPDDRGAVIGTRYAKGY
jgi:hypothetical protein